MENDHYYYLPLHTYFIFYSNKMGNCDTFFYFHKKAKCPAWDIGLKTKKLPDNCVVPDRKRR